MRLDKVVKVMQKKSFVNSCGVMSKFTISTGTKSAMLSSLHIIVWNIPLPTADTIPVGPFQLSHQPLRGSFILDKTENIFFKF